MQLIKNKTISEDSWQYLADDDALCAGNICVSLARWLHDKDQLQAHDGELGVRLLPSDTLSELIADLPRFALVELYFPEFADGRLFSFAWLLRNRYDYSGELRAVGSYLTDQLFYLSRVGVNAFSVKSVEELHITLAKLHDFSVQYQLSVN
jgi:uncharacterized protein (DUF934 family)